MKKLLTVLSAMLIALGIALPVSAAGTVKISENIHKTMGSALIVLSIILGILLICCVVFTLLHFTGSKQKSKMNTVILIVLYAAAAIVLFSTIFCFIRYKTVSNIIQLGSTQPTSTATTAPTQAPTTVVTEPTTQPTEPTPPPTEPDPTYSAEYNDDSDPKNWNVRWDIHDGNSVVDTYTREEKIEFADSAEYTAVEGITTFRGDNYRTGATFGVSEITEKKLTKVWEGQLDAFNTWTGAGWTGQPLVARWDAETKKIMNLYEDKKSKENLTEVIYATMDGYVRFFDLDDGSLTRDPIYIGMNFKGSGTLDPRGYPVLYVGSGDFVPSLTYSGKAPRIYAISLIDGKIMDERSGADGFALRGWYAFDSAPLVDAQTDSLIWAAENGIIYTFDLNTQYDKTAGTISMKLEVASKVRYNTKLGRTLGFESSPIIVGSYLYAGDNSGMFFCMDLNTMELVWAQEIHDDLNATPVFEWGDDGKGYLYLATSLEFSKGTCYLYKLDAANGNVVWEKTYDDIPYNKDVSGGALSSPLLGRKGTSLEGMIIFSIARTPSYDSGTLVALDTQTGDVVWEKTMSRYTWSSPVAAYTQDNTGYIILCDASGKMSLIDGSDGTTLDAVNFGSNVEASPVVFENMVVVGTRGQQVYGIKIS